MQRPADPRQVPADPRQVPADPRQEPADPRQGPADPRQGTEFAVPDMCRKMYISVFHVRFSLQIVQL